MIDIKYIMKNPEKIREVCRQRNMEVDVNKLIATYTELARLKTETEKLRCMRNVVTNEITGVVNAKGDAVKQIEEMKALKEVIAKNDRELEGLEAQYRGLLLAVPNILHEDVPRGGENVVVKEWGEIPRYDFEPKPHWEICENLGLVDFENGVKLAGERGFFLTGTGAIFVRAIRNFLLDLHGKCYEELNPPIFVNHEVLVKTGFFPGGEKEVYETEDGKVFVGTAEIPLIARFAGRVFQKGELPKKQMAFTPCFRREAGKHGKDTRGVFRTHQFEKVELATIAKPEDAMREFEMKVKQIEKVYQLLKLPYRVVDLRADDCAKKEYYAKDIEVWFAAENKWAELGTVANCHEYAARRAGLKYDEGGRTRYCHTIYGTGGVPIRLMIAIINNCQNEDGTIDIPKVLQPYMGGARKLG